ncbi:MAG: AfsR/SARP family transcriptional regulator [Trebonia sp.]
MGFRLLGPLEACFSGESLTLGGPRQRAVLAALLMRANRVSTMEYLTEATWDKPPAAPESNIRTYVAGLRRRLGGQHASARRLTGRPGGYLLQAFPGELDSDVFSELVDEGDAALRNGDSEAALDRFGQALALWRGRPMEGLEVGAPLRAGAARLEAMRVSAAQRFAEAASALGRHDETVTLLRGLTAEHPLDERLWAELMSALHWAGRRAEVLDAYAQIRRRLIDELGIEPGPQLRRLHQRALA